MKSWWKKWFLVLKIVPIILLVVLLKIIFHLLGWEFMDVNPLFTSLVAGTIFLLGFLITGVLADYKESEKIPGEMAASLEVLHDEVSIIHKNRKNTLTTAFFSRHQELLTTIKRWLYRKESTATLLQKISQLNLFFAGLETLTAPPFIARLKQEQNNLRRAIIRIQMIRETSFVSSAYAIVEVLAFFLTLGLITMNIEPFYESLFFVALVTFLILYMILLIKNLDNPFEYGGANGTQISLKPLDEVERRLYR